MRFLRYPLGAVALIASLAAALRPSADAPMLPAPPPADGLPAFRLGTAALPFGWATAVADFNRDGIADTAIADRRSRSGDGYRYELRFSISGLGSRSVWFESAQPALTVSVRDVDHDNDLDVVVTEVLSRVVTNVWLNDGRGHFTESAPTGTPARVEAVPALDGGDPAAAPAASTTGGERPSAVRRFAGPVPAVAVRNLASGRSEVPLSTGRDDGAPLRAPPGVSTPAS